MPRARNHLPTVTITISTTPQVQRHLVDLLATGLYGKNVAEAAERLIAQSVERKAVEGALPRRRARR
jgi:hypothetical protein